MPKYYPINEEAAKRAKDMNSFSDYQPGSATTSYRAMVDEAYAAAERQKARVDPMYHDKIDALVDRYARKLAENLNERNVIDARMPSILISGGGNFPVTKKHKQKGPAYERWAKVYNLKQMAAALQYLQEHHLTDYAALTARTEAAVDHFHKLSDELRTTEEALSKTSELMAATVDYAKTRPVFDGYKAARYSKKYLAQHEVELATYRAAKDTMNTILNGAKLPKIEALKKSRRELAGQKKELYAEYRDAQRQMREAVAIKANIDHLLGITDERENKAQER